MILNYDDGDNVLNKTIKNDIMVIDFSQVVFSTVLSMHGAKQNLDENLLRHIILNILLTVRKKFKNQYKETIIACDSKNSWRYDIFPYYKMNRRLARDKDAETKQLFSILFDILEKMVDELKNNFPYKIIKVQRTEADDIIATLALHNNGETIIISGDKDFMQLQKHSNIKQYDLIKKAFVKCSNADDFLKEHIIKGDIGDGIPNILSDDDSFIMKKRQTPITQKRLYELKNALFENALFNNIKESVKRNFNRNKKLIDLMEIPQEIKNSILIEYENCIVTNNNLMNYFIEKRLKNLMQDIGDFA